MNSPPTEMEHSVKSVRPDGLQQSEKCFLTQTQAEVQEEFIFRFQNICVDSMF